MFDLKITNATLPDGRTGIDIGVTAGKIVAVEPNLAGEAGETIDAGGHLVSPPLSTVHFHMDATLSLGLPRLNESGTLLEGIALWGELKPLLTHEAVIERALRYCDLAGQPGAARDPHPCRRLRRPAARRRGAARGQEAGRALYRPPARRLPAGRLLPLPERRRAARARARPRRRCGRRHPAFRAHDGRRRRERDGALRDRGEARPARRPPLRRDRRSDEPPHRDAGLRDAAARPRRPGRRLASHLDALDGQLLRLEAPAADGGGRRRGDRQSADQHHHPGPPRHLPQAPRHEPRAGDAGAGHHRRLRAGLLHGPLVLARLGRHARASRRWASMSPR